LNQPEIENLVAGIEDDPIAQSLPERANFIPLRHTDLRSRLAQVFAIKEGEHASFDELCNLLQAIFHVEHLSILLQLEEVYCHLDPDSELLDLDSTDSNRLNQLANALVDQLSQLLFSAHYKRLTREELEAAIEIGSQWGVRLDVDFEIFDQLEIFARGYRTITVDRRRWKNLFRLEKIELPEFQRLILVFRTKPSNENEKKKRVDRPLDSNCVYLKTFKNIPETDLDILLPGSRVRLTRLDHAKILLPTVSGTFITLYKIFRGALVLTIAFRYSAIIGWIIFLGASIGYIGKSVLSYFRTKTKYQFGLTKSLYLKNLDNNLSVIYRILNEAEDQELCEAILAYAMLWKHDEIPSEGATSSELDQLSESFLTQASGVDVDFEIHDALGKLARLGLAQLDTHGRWTAVPANQALLSLNKNWRKLFKSKTRADEPDDLHPASDGDLFTS
jgi:hypothetical protein